jgi:dTMP kinase
MSDLNEVSIAIDKVHSINTIKKFCKKTLKVLDKSESIDVQSFKIAFIKCFNYIFNDDLGIELKKKGIIINLEGIDASGKETQTKMLSDFIENETMFHSVIFSFPTYNDKSPSANIITAMLNGVFGSIGSINNYIRLAAYTADRNDMQADIKSALKKNDFVIFDRYALSNLYNIKLNNSTDDIEFEKWCTYMFDLEFKQMKNIIPNFVYYLDSSLSFVEEQLKLRKHTDQFETMKFQKEMRNRYLRFFDKIQYNMCVKENYGMKCKYIRCFDSNDLTKQLSKDIVHYKLLTNILLDIINTYSEVN